MSTEDPLKETSRDEDGEVDYDIDDEEFVPERVVAHRKNKDTKQDEFRVLWEGFDDPTDPDATSWEPGSWLREQGHEDLIIDFEVSRQTKKNDDSSKKPASSRTSTTTTTTTTANKPASSRTSTTTTTTTTTTANSNSHDCTKESSLLVKKKGGHRTTHDQQLELEDDSDDDAETGKFDDLRASMEAEQQAVKPIDEGILRRTLQAVSEQKKFKSLYSDSLCVARHVAAYVLTWPSDRLILQVYPTSKNTVLRSFGGCSYDNSIPRMMNSIRLELMDESSLLTTSPMFLRASPLYLVGDVLTQVFLFHDEVASLYGPLDKFFGKGEGEEGRDCFSSSAEDRKLKSWQSPLPSLIRKTKGLIQPTNLFCAENHKGQVPEDFCFRINRISEKARLGFRKQQQQHQSSSAGMVTEKVEHYHNRKLHSVEHALRTTLGKVKTKPSILTVPRESLVASFSAVSRGEQENTGEEEIACLPSGIAWRPCDLATFNALERHQVFQKLLSNAEPEMHDLTILDTALPSEKAKRKGILEQPVALLEAVCKAFNDPSLKELQVLSRERWDPLLWSSAWPLTNLSSLRKYLYGKEEE